MDISENLLYLKTNVKPILEPLVAEILKNKPDNLTNFSIQYLRKHIRNQEMLNEAGNKEE